jgi:DNA-nicking Smr family endonuclease
MAGAGVAPLPETRRIRVPPAPPCRVSPRFRLWEEMDAYESLAQFVAGEGCFELSYSDEYVDGAIAGLSPKILKKLRNGDFSCQDHVDLHGCNVDRAYDVVVGFVRRSYGQGRRCVLIIPGRGLNSEGRMPVLKKNLVGWLTHAPLNRLVLAFTSARSYDGGVGALYVLMRRNPGKGRFVTPVV